MYRLLARFALSALMAAAVLGVGAPPAGAWWPADGRPVIDGSTAEGSTPPAAFAVAPAQLPGERGYLWPTGREAEVLRGFSAPADPWAPGHRGVDLSHPVGAEVLAAGDGVVAFAGWVVDRHVVSIDHGDGIRTTYEPIDPAVMAGDALAAGAPIGRLAPGHCSAPVECLHWGARTGAQEYLDPLSLLGEVPVIRLLPMGGR